MLSVREFKFRRRYLLYRELSPQICKNCAPSTTIQAGCRTQIEATISTRKTLTILVKAKFRIQVLPMPKKTLMNTSTTVRLRNTSISETQTRAVTFYQCLTRSTILDTHSTRTMRLSQSLRMKKMLKTITTMIRKKFKCLSTNSKTVIQKFRTRDFFKSMRRCLAQILV